MRFLTVAVASASLLLAGCEYDTPLVSDAEIPVDSSLVGLWEPLDEEGAPDPSKRMMILQFSETEYMVHYPAGVDGIYYRAYPVRLGETSCVQIEVIGTGEGPISRSDADRYHVVAYQLEDGEWTVRTLNSDLVSDELPIDGMQKAFLQHQSHPELFTGPGVFRKAGR
jgi:hypothetical protein